MNPRELLILNEIAKSYPEIILGFIIFSAILGVLRIIFSQYLENKRISFQKIEIINNILKFNLNKSNARQKFTAEQAFSAVFGRSFIFNEIKAVLNYDSPSEAIRLYLKGRRFLKVSRTGKSFVLNKNYYRFEILKKYFYFQDTKFFFLYIIFSLLAILPITIIYTIYTNDSWFADNLGLINIFWAAIAGIVALMLIGFAIINILQSGKIAHAFKLAAKNS